MLQGDLYAKREGNPQNKMNEIVKTRKVKKIAAAYPHK